jgi:hypothetical protein
MQILESQPEEAMNGKDVALAFGLRRLGVESPFGQSDKQVSVLRPRLNRNRDLPQRFAFALRYCTGGFR